MLATSSGRTKKRESSKISLKLLTNHNPAMHKPRPSEFYILTPNICRVLRMKPVSCQRAGVQSFEGAPRLLGKMYSAVISIEANC